MSVGGPPGGGDQHGLPERAVSRLRDLASRQGTPDHLFTSDLSIAELGLTRQVGFEPLGQVMGASVYHVGYQWMRASWALSGQSYELDVLTNAYAEARSLALSRLKHEAGLLRATAVVGVRLIQRRSDWDGVPLEFSAIGTAVREIAARRSDDPHKPPVITTLSGQEYWTLLQAGFRPVGIAAGNCTYYQVSSYRTRQAMSSVWSAFQNQELTDYTRSLYTARALTMNRMNGQARVLGGSGIVDTKIHIDAEPHHVESNNTQRVDLLYHCTAIGTAIVPWPGPRARPGLSGVIPLT